MDGDSVDGDRRRITVALRSAAGAHLLGVRLPAGVIALERINGVEPGATRAADRAGGERVSEILHYGRPETDLVLELVMAPTVTQPAIEVIEHHLRPGRLLGESWFLRPPSLAPNVAGSSDRALTRETVPLVSPEPGVAGRRAAAPATGGLSGALRGGR
jgi:hypothetical protein